MKNIPNILHMIWIGKDSPPSYFNDNILKWKKYMPDWNYKIWTNDNLTEEFIDISYLNLINKTNIGAQKADLLRYYVVNKFGGYYVDADIEPKRSLEELPLENENFILCHDLEITWEYIINSFFASTSNNLILEYIIKEMYNVDFTNKNVIFTTGPHILGKAYFLMKENVNTLILPYYYFYRNRKGDEHIDCTVVEEDIVGVFGSHCYANTWQNESN